MTKPTIKFAYRAGNIIVIKLEIECPKCKAICEYSLGGTSNEFLYFPSVEWFCQSCRLNFFPQLPIMTAHEYYYQYLRDNETISINDRSEIEQCFYEDTRKNVGVKKGRGSNSGKVRRKKKPYGSKFRYQWGET